MWIFKSGFMYVIMAWCFPLRFFFQRCSEWPQVYFSLRAFFESLKFFFYVIYLFHFSIMFFPFTYFTPKLFCFFYIRFLGCPCTFFTYLLVEVSLVILKCLVLFVLLEPTRESFKSPMFHQYLLIYQFKSYCQTCCFILVFLS